ncbi:hypothetical protein HJC23_006549 [Cyclotella cryptica]|uniref:Uncharacterized protein n=1 Tax=Cyclotella cryptica TaxID=29204 RepID=A0ABD3PMI4_9STRA|eukprot:CCRYP_013635-RA/>CCRYP_013635-RA protein AED:0.40 eAED:0.40 QI:0/-1/0/1/-1/1/1/0/167
MLSTSIANENPSQFKNDTNTLSNATQLHSINQEPQFQHDDVYRELLTILFNDEVSYTDYANRANQESQDIDGRLASIDAPSSSIVDVDFGIVDSLTLVDSKLLISKILEYEDSEEEFDNRDEDQIKEEYSDGEKKNRSPRYHRRRGVRRSQGHLNFDSYTFAVATKY